jgi:uncharacterized protein YdhG (YjbR/CyaY superfamily)
MSQSPETIDAYIATQPKDVQTLLGKLRRTIRKTAPDAVESISYQMPAFKWNGRMLIYFAAWKKHIAVYPIPPGTKAFEKRIAPYRKGKGTLHFPLGEPMPYDLIAEIVGFAMKRNQKMGETGKTANVARRAKKAS